MRRGIETKERPVPDAVAEQSQTSTEPTCAHHWIIESPAGSMSLGTCKVCGAQRYFQNYSGDFIWEGDSSESYGSGGWRKPVTEVVRPSGSGNEGEESSFAGGDGLSARGAYL